MTTDQQFLARIEALSVEAKKTVQPEALWDDLLRLIAMVRERDAEIEKLKPERKLWEKEYIAVAKDNLRLMSLLERCRDRLDDFDESDELWCAVNAALGAGKE